MKTTNLINTLFFLCLPFSTMGQLQKGNLLLSASLNYSHSTSETPVSFVPGVTTSRNARSYSITPQVGILVKPTLLMGLQASVGQDKYDITDQYGTFLTTQNLDGRFYSFGFFAQKYFEIGGRFYFYLGSSVGYTEGNTKSFSTTLDQSGNSTNTYDTSYGSNELNASLYPGITYFISRSFALEMAFGGLAYGRSILENDATNSHKSNRFYFNFDWFSNGISLQYYLDRQRAPQ